MAITQFRQMLRTQPYLVLDTETTGLNDGEICQIAVLSSEGDVLLNSLVKPVRRIPYSATQIHGITDAMVGDAPSWKDISPSLMEILRGQQVVVYNAVYDRRMMEQSAMVAGLPRVDWTAIGMWWCAMEAFAEIYGQRGRHGYKWQKLSTAARYYGIPVKQAHDALGDVRMTLEICKRIAG